MQKLIINDTILKQQPNGFVKLTLDVTNHANQTIDALQLEVTAKDENGKVLEFAKKTSFEVVVEDLAIPAGTSGKIEDIDLGKSANVKKIRDAEVVVKGVSLVESQISQSVPQAQTSGQGASQTATSSQNPTQTASQPAQQIPKPPRKSLNEILSGIPKKRIVAITAPICTLLILVVVYFIVNNTVFSANSELNAYVGAVKNGDVSKAFEIANPDISSEDKDISLKIPLSEGKRMTDVQIGDISDLDGSGKRFKSTVKYRLNNNQFQKDIVLEKSGSNFGIFQKWQIVSSLGEYSSVQIPSVFGKFNINGVEISSAEDSIYLLPGVYSITVPISKFFTNLGEQNSVISGDTKKSLTYEIKSENITDELKKAVSDEYIKFVNWCATSTSAKTPEDCPFSYSYSSSSYSNFKWSITEMPKVEVFTQALAGGGSNEYLRGLWFKVIDGNAKLSYTYSYSGWFSSSSSNRSTDVSFSSSYSDCQSSSYSSYDRDFVGCVIKINGDKVELYIDGDNISKKAGNTSGGTGTPAADANTPAPDTRTFVTNYPDYGICVRTTPDINGGKCDVKIQGNVLIYINKGDTSVKMKYLDKSEVHDGHTWYNVQLSDSRTGWVRDDVVREE